MSVCCTNLQEQPILSFLVAVGPCPMKIRCKLPRKDSYSIDECKMFSDVRLPRQFTAAGNFKQFFFTDTFVLYCFLYDDQAACGNTDSLVHETISLSRVVTTGRLDLAALLSMECRKRLPNSFVVGALIIVQVHYEFVHNTVSVAAKC